MTAFQLLKYMTDNSDKVCMVLQALPGHKP